MRHRPTDEARRHFQEHGVLVVSDFLSASDVHAHTARVRDLLPSALHIRRVSEANTLDYHVITGDVIRTHAAALWDTYASAGLLDWIRQVAATQDVDRSPHLRSAVNINVLDRAGQQYRWHTDAVPYTALLFLTSLPSTAGGSLLVRTYKDDVAVIPPVAGQLVLMDGCRCAHAVAPLQVDALRITVPMVFPACQVERPDGLDDYLYASGQS